LTFWQEPKRANCLVRELN